METTVSGSGNWGTNMRRFHYATGYYDYRQHIYKHQYIDYSQNSFSKSGIGGNQNSHMRSEHSTSELQPRMLNCKNWKVINSLATGTQTRN